jgi:dihydroorotase
MTKINKISLRRPDDWHLHLRDGAMLKAVLPFTARRFARAVVMPNLSPPVRTAAEAKAYKKRILAALPKGMAFAPLMTCYLTDHTDPADVVKGHEQGVFVAAKLYPAGATTNSARGVTDYARIDPVLARMEKIGMPLLVHGEATDPEIDVFDRERVFLEHVLQPMIHRFPGLKVVFEHATTEDAVSFVTASGDNIAATITPHHLIINRNAMFEGGIRPHMYCLPVAKRERHRLALRLAATSGSPKFFLGTDSAPHPIAEKESACGCAGLFTAPAALELYARVFDEENALDRFEAFASLNGPAFYGLPVNEDRLTLVRRKGRVPGDVKITGVGAVHPFMAGGALTWSVEG